ERTRLLADLAQPLDLLLEPRPLPLQEEKRRPRLLEVILVKAEPRHGQRRIALQKRIELVDSSGLEQIEQLPRDEIMIPMRVGEAEVLARELQPTRERFRASAQREHRHLEGYPLRRPVVQMARHLDSFVDDLVEACAVAGSP